MFGSSILDTLLGVVFMFLLVSMLVTIINEMIAASLKSRAKWLRIGIDKLLGTAWARQLYAHPLVAASARTSTGPSYIPSRSFANVVMDLIRDGNATITQAQASLQGALAAAGAGPDVTITQLHLALQQVAAQATAALPASPAAQRLATDIALLRATLPTTVGGAVTEIRKFAEALPDIHLRASIESITADEIRKPLLALYDDARNDVEKFKQNIEIWFDNAMDRVGGWYKRRAQWVTFGLGVVLAVALNVDTIEIARYLQHEPGVRQALVAQAAAYARTDPLAAPGGAGNAADPAVLEARFKAVRTELDNLGLPIGWPIIAPAGARPQPAAQPAAAAGKDPCADSFWKTGCKVASMVWQALPDHWLGWLVTALAATLGAPFWFDTLNRLMSIRSAGKAPEETPKPPKEVPVPLGPGQTPQTGPAHGH